jgi:tetratricopeptide (TPR) repeat protein
VAGMKQNIEKILNILSGDHIKQEETKQIENIIASDPEAKEFFKEFNNIEKLVKASSHLSEEDLADYILYKNNNLQKSPNTANIKLIEKHLKNCAKCSSAFMEFSEEYSGIDKYLSDNFLKTKQQAAAITAFKSSFSRYKTLRYSLTFATVVAVLFLFLAIVSQLTTPPNYRLASVKESSLNYVTRGRATDEFQKGLAALDNKNISEAVSFFKADIADNKNDETIFYTNYILGLTYLENSKNDFLGLFPSYDEKKVNDAIDNFRQCILKNNSGSFPDITASSYFFMAKAELMLNYTLQAKKDLQMVIDANGSRSDDAKKLLNELQ